MLLHIKNMVCDRCILIVRQELQQLGFEVKKISLGMVDVGPEPDEQQLRSIAEVMQGLGFELMDDEKQKLVELVKTKVIALVHYSNLAEINVGLITLIANELHKEPSSLSRLFSEIEGITIEKYIIQQKVEKVKDLLEYGQLNLNEIAFKMGYSSSAHLSTQFKSVTGLSPSQYKSRRVYGRRAIDQL